MAATSVAPITSPLILPLIDEPFFGVDLSGFRPLQREEAAPSPAPLASLQRLKEISNFALRVIGVLFASMGRSFYYTCFHIGTSFKINVLGYYNNWSTFSIPLHPAQLVLKVAYFVLLTGLGFVATTLRLTYEALQKQGDTALLFQEQFGNTGIDMRHLRTKETSIDVRHVPPTLQIEALLTLLDSINFEDPNKPGYMPPTALQSVGLTFTREQLRENLTTAISRIRGRVPFLGTPPAHDIPRLLAFYQQIEDALRFSLHKVMRELENFRSLHPDLESLSAEERATYSNLLENAARLSLDFAIGAKDCGARYMSEAMQIYASCQEEMGAIESSLEDDLVALLGNTRLKVAEDQIQQHLGADAHDYTKYMAGLGSLLAIPGTAFVIEHLSTLPHKECYLQLFFQAYTVNRIIEVVQHKIQTSQIFREKVTDWFKSQVGNWNLLVQEVRLEALKGVLTAILEGNGLEVEAIEIKSFLRLEELISYCHRERIALPERVDGEAYLATLLAHEPLRGYLNTTVLQGVEGSDKAEAKQAMRNLENTLGPSLIQKIRSGALLSLAEFKPQLLQEERVRRLLHMQRNRSLFGVQCLNTDSARILCSKAPHEIRAALASHLDGEREDAFLRTLIPTPEDLAPNPQTRAHGKGLSQELLEWLLVSNHILLPQGDS